jgi:hypothetical protein
LRLYTHYQAKQKGGQYNGFSFHTNIYLVVYRNNYARNVRTKKTLRIFPERLFFGELLYVYFSLSSSIPFLGRSPFLLSCCAFL